VYVKEFKVAEAARCVKQIDGGGHDRKVIETKGAKEMDAPIPRQRHQGPGIFRARCEGLLYERMNAFL
jgi:hypothetical protein